MSQAVRRFVLLGFFAAALRAQPGIGQNGVVNSASQIPPTLEGGALARGALFSVTGVRLGSTSGRTTATISKQGIALPVRIISLQPRKLEALLPANTPLGPNDLVITADGRASRPFRIEVVAYNPGIFSRNLEGWGPGRIDNLDAKGNRSDNSTANPAHHGDIIAIATTGMGAAKDADIMIGDRPVKGQVAARGVREGEDRITFTLPPNVPLGCWVPVYVMAAPLRASNVVTMSIHNGAGACDSGPIPLLQTKASVVVTLSRGRMKDIRPGASDSLSDNARVSIRQASQTPLLSRNDLPPVGTCTASTSSYQVDSDLAVSLTSIAVPSERGLDGGVSLMLTRETLGRLAATSVPESRDIGQNFEGQGSYRARLGFGGLMAKRGSPPPFLEPGEYVLQSSGGKDAGAFRAQLTMPAPFLWKDRDQITAVDRKKGVTVHWTPGGSPAGGDARDQLIVILARNVDRVSTAIGMCLCTARENAGQFTIPAALLANIPASIDAPGERYDKLVLGSMAAKALPSLKAKGVDGGVVFTVYDSGRVVDYR